MNSNRRPEADVLDQGTWAQGSCSFPLRGTRTTFRIAVNSGRVGPAGITDKRQGLVGLNGIERSTGCDRLPPFSTTRRPPCPARSRHGCAAASTGVRPTIKRARLRWLRCWNRSRGCQGPREHERPAPGDRVDQGDGKSGTTSRIASGFSNAARSRAPHARRSGRSAPSTPARSNLTRDGSNGSITSQARSLR